MKDCPQCTEVTKFLQGTSKPSTPTVLSQPFPSQQQAQLVIHDQLSSSTTSYVLMCTGDSKESDVALTTRAKDYSPSKEKVDDLPPSLVQPSPTTPPTNNPLHLERLSLDTVLRPPPQRASFRNRLSILMLVLPRTIALLKIWPKHLLRCQPLKSFKLVPHNGRHGSKLSVELTRRT